MKFKLLALAAFTAFALPGMAQSVFIDGPTDNGDLEADTLDPFGANGGTISEDQVKSGTQSMQIDLTANNSFKQWRGITTGPSYSTNGTDRMTHSVWVYIPPEADTTFGATANLNLQLQASPDGATGWGNFPNGSAITSLALGSADRETWIEVIREDIVIPADKPFVRLNHNIQTLALIGPEGGLVRSDGADGTAATGDDSGADLAGPAVPADWEASGYKGVIYLDDFHLSSQLPPPPPPVGTLICEEWENGNFEAEELAPWNPARGAGDIDTVIFNTAVNPGHVQSMSVDMGAPGLDGNRWRGMGLSASMPATHGDIIGTAVWCYVPSTTNFNTKAKFGPEVRTDRNTTGNGNEGPVANVDMIAQKADFPDQWRQYTVLTTVEDGDKELTSVNVGGWHIETENGVDQNALGYNGLVYFDDVKFMNLGPGPTSDGPGVMVGPNDNNGDLEGDFPAPWGGVEPWTFSGAGSANTDTAYTRPESGSAQSVCVDLTANNSNAQWKGQHTTLPTVNILDEGFDRVDVTAWVYIPPIEETTFGAVASLNFPLYNGSAWGANGGSLDLTTASRGEWIEVGFKGIDVSGFDQGVLAINNWNLETVRLIGPEGSLVASDGSDRTGDDPAADRPGPAVPADWEASGYKGVFYVDDYRVEAYSSVADVELVINSIDYNGENGEVTLNYDTPFALGADVYWSTDLINWSGPDFASDTGVDQIFLHDTNTVGGDVTELYYIMVEPETTPPPVGP